MILQYMYEVSCTERFYQVSEILDIFQLSVCDALPWKY